jgi:hypothetical protein
MAQRGYRYSLTGNVRNLLGPYVLPSDNKQYFVFGFTAVQTGHTYNPVFYIRFVDAGSPEMSAKVAWSLASGRKITVHFTMAKPWDPDTDPGGVVDGVERRRGR